MTNYRTLLAFATVLLVTLAGCFACNKTDSIKIGCVTALTGESANYGRVTKQGVDLAVSEINQRNLLGKPLVVVYEDDKMEGKDGVNALRKLVDVEKVPLVLGPFGSSVVLACAPIANQTHTVIMSASATADSI